MSLLNPCNPYRSSADRPNMSVKSYCPKKPAVTPGWKGCWVLIGSSSWLMVDKLNPALIPNEKFWALLYKPQQSASNAVINEKNFSHFYNILKYKWL